MTDLAGTAEEVAETLFASADAVERAGTVSRSSLDLLAQHGFYAIAGPPELGGLPERDVWHLVETIASGCLATAFVWIQHHSALRAVAASENAGLRERWCARMSRGQVRAGLAVGGLRPGPASLRARREPGGYRFDGEAPWVTGWGLVDVVHVAARDEDDTIVWALLDAGSPLRAEVHDLVAVTASRTATVYFDDVTVPAERVTGSLPFAAWPARDAAGLRLNGSLALGLADRCRLLLDDLALADSLGQNIAEVRDALDRADANRLPQTRAAASELALRAAATLVTAVGARAVLSGAVAQRLLREAAFLLVFGSRPQIRADLLRRVAAAPMS